MRVRIMLIPLALLHLNPAPHHAAQVDADARWYSLLGGYHARPARAAAGPAARAAAALPPPPPHGHGHGHSLSLGHLGHAGAGAGRAGGSTSIGGSMGASGSASGSGVGGAGGTGHGSGTGGLSVEEAGVRTVLGVVNRVLGLAAAEPAGVRARACFVLYYLVSDDAQLCHAAYDRGCLDVLGALIQDISPREPAPPQWEEGESEALQALREAALTALAALALASDDARRRIASPPPALLPCLARALRASRHTGTRYAAAQCVRAMARSGGVGTAAWGRFGGAASGWRGGVVRVRVVRVQVVVRWAWAWEWEWEWEGGSWGWDGRGGRAGRGPPGAGRGAVCDLSGGGADAAACVYPAGTSDGPLRLSALWAVKNLVRKASTETKRDVMSHVGWTELDSFLGDADEAFQEQAFNLLRNLAENEDGIAMLFRELGAPSSRRASCTACARPRRTSRCRPRTRSRTSRTAPRAAGRAARGARAARCARGGACGRRPRNPRRRREMQEAGSWARSGGCWSGAGMGRRMGRRRVGRAEPAGGRGGYGGAWGAQAEVPRTWSGSGGVLHAALGGGRAAAASAAGHLANEDDREVVGRARLALDWLQHGDTYAS
ncbi:hypothetical protein BJ912DRAFT_1149910 [Pholiota molesta]|nr:hypothetical protein BJ912DRAFT_1149910 [Pholiota molesta]